MEEEREWKGDLWIGGHCLVHLLDLRSFRLGKVDCKAFAELCTGRVLSFCLFWLVRSIISRKGMSIRSNGRFL